MLPGILQLPSGSQNFSSLQSLQLTKHSTHLPGVSWEASLQSSPSSQFSVVLHCPGAYTQRPKSSRCRMQDTGQGRYSLVPAPVIRITDPVVVRVVQEAGRVEVVRVAVDRVAVEVSHALHALPCRAEVYGGVDRHSYRDVSVFAL